MFQEGAAILLMGYYGGVGDRQLGRAGGGRDLNGDEFVREPDLHLVDMKVTK